MRSRQAVMWLVVILVATVSYKAVDTDGQIAACIAGNPWHALGCIIADTAAKARQ